MRVSDGEYLLDLEWIGEAKTDVTVGKYDYGGLFLRMPWREGIRGAVVNAARHRDLRQFQDAARKLTEYIQSCPPSPGFDQVMVPGEFEYRHRQVREREGFDLPIQTWDQLQALAVE